MRRNFFEFSLGTLGGLNIVTGKVYSVVLSLGLPPGYLLEPTNPGAVMPDMLPEAPIGLWFGSEAVRYWCYCCRLTD